MGEKKFTIEELTKIADIAHRYYKQDQKQPDIAKDLNISQTEVSRILKSARDQNIVHFNVQFDPIFSKNLRERLKNVFPHLKEAIVVPVIESEDEYDVQINPLLRALGYETAQFFIKSVHHGDSIGLGCGVTVEAFVKELSRVTVEKTNIPLPVQCKIYQLMIFMMEDMVSVAPSALVSNLMRCLDVPTGYAFQFPEISKKDQDKLKNYLKEGIEKEVGKNVKEIYRELFIKNEHVGKITREFRYLDHYFIGIGSIDYDGIIKEHSRRNKMATYAFNKLIWDKDAKEKEMVVDILKKLDAAGEILYQTYNHKGQILNYREFEDEKSRLGIGKVKNYLRRYCECLPLKDLYEIVNNGGVIERDNKEIDVNIVSIAGGKRKHHATHAALKAKLFNVLITDSMTADYVLTQESHAEERHKMPVDVESTIPV